MLGRCTERIPIGKVNRSAIVDYCLSHYGTTRALDEYAVSLKALDAVKSQKKLRSEQNTEFVCTDEFLAKFIVRNFREQNSIDQGIKPLRLRGKRTINICKLLKLANSW